MQKIKTLCFLVFVSFGLVSCDYLRLRSIHKDLSNQNCESAKMKALQGLKKDSQDLKYHYSLLHALFCEESFDKAFQQMDYIMTYKDSGYEFNTLFIKAYVLGQQGHVDEALHTYQNALAYKPSKEVKQNMELLLEKGKQGKSQKDKSGKGKSEENPKDKKENEDNKKNPDADKSEHDEKQQQEESQKKKSLSEKQVQQIMKEIDNDEKKVRSQGIEIKKGKGQQSEKNW